MKKILEKNLFLFCLFLIFILYVSTINNFFFWDTVQLASKHANFYFQNDFKKILLPDDMDSGHIPAFGAYIALVWKIFGRTLINSHLAMLPLIIGLIWQLYFLIDYFFKKSNLGIVFLLLLLDPTLLSQLTLVSPDIALIFGLLLGLNSILRNSRFLLCFSILFLFLISMRGMMVAFILSIIDLFINIHFHKNLRKSLPLFFKRIFIYLPALLLFVIFSLYHFKVKGWIGFHSQSPWAESFERVGIEEVPRNIIILIWRILDFGRIGIWIVFGILFILYRKYILNDRQLKIPFLIFILFLVILPLNMIWAKGLLGHRYLLPIFLTFSLFTAKILFAEYVPTYIRKSLIFLWCALTITGNLWVYPQKISQGWDATLAHLPYYHLRLKMIKHIEEKNIPFSSVQSFFPNLGSGDIIDLNGDSRSFTEKNDSANFIFYSNVFNIDDETIDKLDEEFTEVKTFQKSNIYVTLYKKKEDFE